MNPNSTSEERNEILQTTIKLLEASYNDPRKELTVSKIFDAGEAKNAANVYNFNQSNDAKEVLLHAIKGLKEHGVQVTHPSYLGLFNPRPNFPSIMADVINSYLNPQLAVYSHAPFASEIERLVIREFCEKFGYSEVKSDGTFCTGGAESNLTAVLCALQFHFPTIAEEGITNFEKLPTIYCSAESHHSVEKAARIVGLGKRSVRKVAVNDDLSINTFALKKQIEADKKENLHPFMVVGTAGTTGPGAIDDLTIISEICKAENLWFHVDAAYGGGAIITDLKHLLKGVEHSDSITLDLHKFFSVPMATSLFLTSNTSVLHQTFGVRTAYMPADGDPTQVIDPYLHSIQWSRRFIGLKIYLPLAIFGWEGYSKLLTHQIDMGNKMRQLLVENGWTIENKSEYPIICFSHPDLKGDDTLIRKLADTLNNTGATWMSTYPINGKLTLRVQIANYDTQILDIEKFIETIGVEKSKLFE